ncbi:MAG: hypothetical protein BroJett014_21390 [Planctomycetota bacterium]|nr:hypothetical protein [Planctomycetota bacterium]GIK53166.1 MAG: hypothetical protein BroJett014_21390 [Planctomycetota bacterium]
MFAALNHGHSSVEIVHESYTPQGSATSTTNYWKVELESWDDDDPQKPVRIHKYFFDGVTNG